MVQQIEAFRGIFRERGISQEAQELISEFGERLRKIGIPEFIKDVTIFDANSLKYDHPKFIHNRELKTVQLKGGRDIVELTPTENKLLSEFEDSPNKHRDSMELTERIFGEGYSVKLLNKYIERLRKKLEADPKRPEVLTLERHGYIFNDSSRKTSKIQAPLKQEDLKEEVYLHPGFTYYPGIRLLVVGETETFLSPIENKLLELLARNSNRIMTYNRFAEMWEDEGYSSVPGKYLIKSHILRLRRKLEPGKSGKNYEYLLAERGLGYRLINQKMLEAA